MIYLIASEKSWDKNLVESLNAETKVKWQLIENKEDLTLDKLEKIKPQAIFFPHWSHIIPNEIHSKFNCIVFHMTDLPYGRGGSPLQNLIVRGHKSTKLSSLKVDKGLDTGDIYLKTDLSLEGSAQQIFERANDLIKDQIITIVNENLQPIPQSGEPTVFSRRKPEEGNIENLEKLEVVYDYIRMLDAEGYPNAFLETKNFKFEFTSAELNNNESVTANVRITKK